MIRLCIAAVVFFLTAAAMRADAAAPCPAGDGARVWYVSSVAKYYTRGAKEYGVGNGELLCLSDARAAQEVDSTPHHLHKKAAKKKVGKKVGKGDGGLAVIDSVYDTISRNLRYEHTGYGRYTYVLLTTKSETERNAALLSAIMETTPAAESVSTPYRYLNVFELPEKAAFDRGSARAADSAYALASYDFGFAHDLLLRACAAPKRPRVCSGSLAGPFLLTYGKPLGSVDIANPPYLIVDLHYLNPKGFTHVVAMMKEQVKQTDVTDGRLVENWSVRLLSTTLDVSDWLPNIISSAKQLRGDLVTTPASR